MEIARHHYRTVCNNFHSTLKHLFGMTSVPQASRFLKSSRAYNGAEIIDCISQKFHPEKEDPSSSIETREIIKQWLAVVCCDCSGKNFTQTFPSPGLTHDCVIVRKKKQNRTRSWVRRWNSVPPLKRVRTIYNTWRKARAFVCAGLVASLFYYKFQWLQ